MSIDLAPLVYHIRRMAAAPVHAADADLIDRFARLHDESAFTDLIRRHGLMVWRVCRRLLGDVHTAEDAFQATFLVLARRAGAIRRPAALAGWLYGVALRVAHKARSTGYRQRRQTLMEDRDVAGPTDEPAAEANLRDLRRAVDEEVQRLPEVYRLPVILCCLEGHSQEEVACRLGWTAGSVKGRLERGRSRLHSRLQRRGVLPATALAAIGAARDAIAAVPAGLAASTLKAVSLSLMGEAPPAAAVLADGLCRTAPLTKLRNVLVLLLLAGMISAGVATFKLWARPSDPPPPPGARSGSDSTVDEQPRALFQVPLPPRTMMTVTLSADGKLLAVAPHDKTTVALWDVATGKEHTLKGNPFSVTALAFSPDGKTLATGTGSWLPDSAPGEIKLWDVASGKERATLGRLPKMILALAFAPDGKTLASASESVKLWDTTTGKEAADVPVHHPNSVAFAPDGKTLAIGSGVREDNTPGSVILWDTTTGKQRTTLKGHVGMVCCVGFTPDGKTLASADSRGTLKLWDAGTAKERASIRPPDDAHGSFWFQSFAFTADSKSVVATMMLGWPREERSALVLKVWDTANGKEQTIYQPKAKDSPVPVVVSGDATIVGLAGPPLDGPLVQPSAKLELWERRALAAPAPQPQGAGNGNKHAPAATIKAELEKLAGFWKCVGHERDGAEHLGKEASQVVQNEMLLFGATSANGPKLSRETYDGRSGHVIAGVVTLYPTTRPHGIDLTLETGPERDIGKTQPGVYAMEGDKLRLCWGTLGGKDRPTSLTHPQGRRPYRPAVCKRQSRGRVPQERSGRCAD
jgi:RNA polymerase sigma factor (sigma-70 family)